MKFQALSSAADGKLTKWVEGNATFEVFRSSDGRPVELTRIDHRGRASQLKFQYSAAGDFVGSSGDAIESVMLQKLMAEAGFAPIAPGECIQQPSEPAPSPVADPVFVGAQLSRSSNFTLTTGSLTPVIFQSVEFDSAGMTDIDSAGDRLVVQKTGKYSLSCSASLSVNATGRRVIRIENLAGTVVYARSDSPAVPGGVTTIGCSASARHLNAGDGIRVVAFQDSGAPVAIQPSGTQPCTLTAVYLGS